MPQSRDVLTPESLAILQVVAKTGSFAAAARALGQVPSALTYRIRQMEDALDVLLFDRSSRRAQFTEAGETLCREGERLLNDLDSLANRVKRVATGWEPQLTLAVDGAVLFTPIMELCEAFFSLAPPTRIKVREETLSGTLAALTSGQADLAIGVVLTPVNFAGLRSQPLGVMKFVYAVAPHHPLAKIGGPLSDDLLRAHRGVAVADTIQRGDGLTMGLLGGQDVFTVPTMAAKLQAQLRGIGGGFLPDYLAQPYLDSGLLVAKAVQRPDMQGTPSYAWIAKPGTPPGKALQWWLEQLHSPQTRAALLGMGKP